MKAHIASPLISIIYQFSSPVQIVCCVEQPDNFRFQDSCKGKHLYSLFTL